VLTGWANVIGKTMMLRRQAFAAIGGLEAFADILCEDAIIGRRLQKAGYQVVLVPQLGEAVLGDMTLHHFWDHELRWSRLKRYTLGGVRHITEFFWNSTFNALVAIALLFAGARGGASAVGLMILLQLWSDALIWRAFNGRKRDAWLLPLVDFLRFLLIGLSLFGRSVHWRGQIFHLGPETRILGSEPIVASSPAHALPQDRTR
jgi:ceramide glucosyltransferase